MKFYTVGGPYCQNGLEFDFEPTESVKVGDAPKCMVCGNFYALLPLLPPIEGTLCVEEFTFDLSLTSGNDLLLSERCLKAFEGSRVMGLVNTTEINILNIEGGVDRACVGRFFLANAILWGAEIDRVASKLRTTETEVCSSCGYAGLVEGFDGIRLAEGSWTGQDLFRVKGLPGFILATERLKRLLVQHDLNVCKLTPAEFIQRPRMTSSATIK